MRVGVGLLWLSVLGACRFDPAGLAPLGSSEADATTPPGAADAAAVVDAVPASIDAAPVPRGYRRAITLHAARVGGTLQDFPVFVAITDPTLGARAAADGGDLHFTDADGTTALDHEVQRWDAATGRLEAWVRVPALGSAADTVLYLHYGDAASAVPPNPAGVWKNGFAAVWHLEQAPSNQPGSIIDSLGARDGTTSGGLAANDVVDARLGRGLRFAGGDDLVSFDNPLLGATPHTISVWVQQGATSDNDTLVVLGNGACGEARWLHSRFDTGDVAAGLYCDDFLDTGVDVVGQGFVLVHWTHGAGRRSRIYRDGALAAGPFTHQDAPATAGAIGRIGNAPAIFGANMGLHAVVDEVRLSTVERDAAWIATEHANQSDPASFYAVGVEEPVF